MALLCPRLFHYRYVDKIPEPETMPEARLGKALHTVLESALLGQDVTAATEKARAELGGELEQKRFDGLLPGVPKFMDRIGEFRQKRRISRELVEYSLAVKEDETSTAFYSPDALYRGVIDVGFVFGDTLAMVDHKSGARWHNIKINEQLEGYAVLAVAQFSWVKRVWLGVHWLADADVEWAEPMAVEQVKRELLPRVFDNIEAAALAVSDGPRQNPGVWCYRCNYRSICPAGRDVRYEPVDEDPDPGL
jgi:hypothetical protein